MLEITHHTFNTYEQVFLEDWSSLTNLILKHTKHVKETLDGNTPVFSGKFLLNARQIDDALCGPFGPLFKRHINARAQKTRTLTALSFLPDDAYNKDDLPEDTSLGLSVKTLQNIDESAAKGLGKALDHLLQEHEMQWEAHMNEWQDLLINQLTATELAVTENEVNEFYMHMPMSELNERYDQLKLPTGKIKTPPYSFKDYYTLKLILTIHSALSRMHLANADSDIQLVLKKLHGNLKDIAKAEEALHKMQTDDMTQTLNVIN